MKTCAKCQRELAESEFYCKRGDPNVLYSLCKNCAKERVSTPDALAKSRSRHRKSYSENPQPAKDRSKRNAPNRIRKKSAAQYDQMSARCAVRDAIARGEMEKPKACSVCGSPCRVQGHHKDYSLRLDVIWLCGSCHGKAHRKADS